MAKIVTPRLPEATEEYSREQISQLVQTLEQVIFVLNNTYIPEKLREDDERISFFVVMPNAILIIKAKVEPTHSLTTIYTVPTAKTAIIKSIRVANEDTSNDCNITVTLVDSG